MDIKLEKTGNARGEITLSIDKADYEARVEKALKDYRKKAALPGFRPGQAPMGLLRKRFGAEVKSEEVYRLMSESLYKYIREEKLDVMGDPLPSEKQTLPDMVNDESFTFVFDVALAPELNAALTAEDVIDYYRIQATDEMVQERVDMYCRQFGEFKQVDECQDGAMLKGQLAQVGGGISVDEATVMPKYMKGDEQEVAKLLAVKTGECVTLNIYKAYDGNESELSSLLKIDREQVAGLAEAEFTYQVQSISVYEPGKVDQTLFDKAMGEGNVTDEADFRAKIRASIEAQYATESDYKFLIDMRAMLMERAAGVELADDLLKRVVKLNNTEKSAEDIEAKWQETREGIIWQMLMGRLVSQFGIKLEADDLMDAAKQKARMMFAQYGMGNVGDDILARYAEGMVKDEKQAADLQETAMQVKLAAAAKQAVTLCEKTVTPDEFMKMFQPSEEEKTEE